MREIVAGKNCDGVTHTSKHFLVQINLWLSFNHRNVKCGISLVLDTG